MNIQSFLVCLKDQNPDDKFMFPDGSLLRFGNVVVLIMEDVGHIYVYENEEEALNFILLCIRDVIRKKEEQ